MIKGVLFDLDGTLLQTIPDIAASMNRVLERFELPVHPEEDYKTFLGNGAKVLTERAIGNRRELFEKVYKAYREEYAAHTCELTRPYDGIPDMIRSLRDRGLIATVFSNKDQADTENVIHYYFPDGPFAIVRGRQEGIPLKPTPDGALMIAEELHLTPSEILYVGDTGTDMDCGHNAGMITVGVTWGFRSREELEKHKACHLIDRPAELLELL